MHKKEQLELLHAYPFLSPGLSQGQPGRLGKVGSNRMDAQYFFRFMS